MPNGTLANTSLTNVTDKDYRQLDLKVDIAYEADLCLAKKLLQGLVKMIRPSSRVWNIMSL